LAVPADNAKRTAVFLQWQANYSNLFEMINAVRYDAFDLDGEGVSHSGNCISPNTNCNQSREACKTE